MSEGKRAPVRPRPSRARKGTPIVLTPEEWSVHLRNKAIRLLDRVIMPQIYRTFTPRAFELFGDALQRAQVCEGAMGALAQQDDAVSDRTVVELQRALWAEINHRYPGV